MTAPALWQQYLLVAAGGAAGALLRFVVSTGLAPLGRAFAFPLPTLLVNTAGSLILGLLAGWCAASTADRGTHPLWLLLGTGVCGGFTTFSTFSLEAFVLVQAGRPGAAALYAAGSLLLSLGAMAGGYMLGRVVAS